MLMLRLHILKEEFFNILEKYIYFITYICILFYSMCQINNRIKLIQIFFIHLCIISIDSTKTYTQTCNNNLRKYAK